MRLPIIAMFAAVGSACSEDTVDTKPSGDDDVQVADHDSGDSGGDDSGGDDSGGDDSGGDDSGGDDSGGDDSGGEDGLSAVNSYSEAGCDLLEVTPESLVLGASESEANTAVLVPDNETAWVLQMPESGDGWFAVEIPDWMTTVHVFTEDGVDIEVMGGEIFTDALRNGACPDAGISDQRMAFHEWGAYTVRIAEGAPAEVWFTLVKVE